MTKNLSIVCDISRETILNLLDSSSRGSSYWCRSDLAFYNTAKRALTKSGVMVRDIESEPSQSYRLNKDSIVKGLQIMLQKAPNHFADIISEDTDEITADVFLQCCIFGDIIYG